MSDSKDWQHHGLGIKYTRHDNAGENKVFIKMANGPKWCLHIVPEFTGAGTPNCNQLVTLGSTSLSVQAWAMLSRENLPLYMRYMLIYEVLSAATYLSNLQQVEFDGTMLGMNISMVKHLGTLQATRIW